MEKKSKKIPQKLKEYSGFANKLLRKLATNVQVDREYIDGQNKKPKKRKLADPEQEPVQERQEIQRIPLFVPITRNETINPAPHSRDFRPQFVDIISGVEYDLADDSPLAFDHDLTDVKAVVFYARASGTLKSGEARSFPALHTKVVLSQVGSGNTVGYGYVAERFFTRKRVMGTIVMKPMVWLK